MNNAESIEKTIRDTLVNQIAMKQVEFLELDEDLTLDSLSQAELRVFIAGEYDVPTDIVALPVAATETLEALISHIQNATTTAA
ncbi:MAG: hypothetical protein COA42_12455 [Alteromonadaceae bacterium]|nr:MAG: hypothetical protein COA42_12455 [Alteromonadaceae bacterium]